MIGFILFIVICVILLLLTGVDLSLFGKYVFIFAFFGTHVPIDIISHHRLDLNIHIQTHILGKLRSCGFMGCIKAFVGFEAGESRSYSSQDIQRTTFEYCCIDIDCVGMCMEAVFYCCYCSRLATDIHSAFLMLLVLMLVVSFNSCHPQKQVKCACHCASIIVFVHMYVYMCVSITEILAYALLQIYQHLGNSAFHSFTSC